MSSIFTWLLYVTVLHSQMTAVNMYHLPSGCCVSLTYFSCVYIHAHVCVCMFSGHKRDHAVVNVLVNTSIKMPISLAVRLMSVAWVWNNVDILFWNMNFNECCVCVFLLPHLEILWVLSAFSFLQMTNVTVAVSMSWSFLRWAIVDCSSVVDQWLFSLTVCLLEIAVCVR